jgi:hydroxymethylpyrimidine/phosphomethylpyrimidine kinase
MRWEPLPAHLSYMNLALTIAGSDSGGGAGIQADLKTFHQHGVFGMAVITAVTAQNTIGVTEWEPVSPALARAQIDAVATDLRPDAVKSGMLGSADVAAAIADALAEHRFGFYVLDPVLIATSGDSLAGERVIDIIRSRLIPQSTLVTPNTDEAAALTGRAVNDETELVAAARYFVENLGANAALVKGGHLEGSEVVDAFFDGELRLIRRPRLATSSTHGTGCTLSAAIAARLAQGDRLADAVRAAGDYVHRALASAPGLGRGRGPLNHFAPVGD